MQAQLPGLGSGQASLSGGTHRGWPRRLVPGTKELVRRRLHLLLRPQDLRRLHLLTEKRWVRCGGRCRPHTLHVAAGQDQESIHSERDVAAIRAPAAHRRRLRCPALVLLHLLGRRRQGILRSCELLPDEVREKVVLERCELLLHCGERGEERAEGLNRIPHTG